MNHLIICAHPNGQNSFNRAMVEQVIKTSQQQGINCTLRDLYSMNFNPVLSWEEMQGARQGIIPQEIQHEHQLIDQADLITLIYPLWWMGFPALLKGYLDRVLSHGFAYKTENGVSVGLLHGKRMQQFISIGSNLEKYQQSGFDKSLRDCLVDGLFHFCGIKDIEHSLFGDIHVIDQQAREAILQEIAEKTQQNIAALLANNAPQPQE